MSEYIVENPWRSRFVRPALVLSTPVYRSPIIYRGRPGLYIRGGIDDNENKNNNEAKTSEEKDSDIAYSNSEIESDQGFASNNMPESPTAVNSIMKEFEIQNEEKQKATEEEENDLKKDFEEWKEIREKAHDQGLQEGKNSMETQLKEVKEQADRIPELERKIEENLSNQNEVNKLNGILDELKNRPTAGSTTVIIDVGLRWLQQKHLWAPSLADDKNLFKTFLGYGNVMINALTNLAGLYNLALKEKTSTETQNQEEPQVEELKKAWNHVLEISKNSANPNIVQNGKVIIPDRTVFLETREALKNVVEQMRLRHPQSSITSKAQDAVDFFLLETPFHRENMLLQNINTRLDKTLASEAEISLGKDLMDSLTITKPVERRRSKFQAAQQETQHRLELIRALRQRIPLLIALLPQGESIVNIEQNTSASRYKTATTPPIANISTSTTNNNSASTENSEPNSPQTENSETEQQEQQQQQPLAATTTTV